MPPHHPGCSSPVLDDLLQALHALLAGAVQGGVTPERAEAIHADLAHALGKLSPEQLLLVMARVVVAVGAGPAGE